MPKDKRYKNPKWLYKNYITLNKSIPVLAFECRCVPSTIWRSLVKNNIKKRKGLYFSKDGFICRYCKQTFDYYINLLEHTKKVHKIKKIEVQKNIHINLKQNVSFLVPYYTFHELVPYIEQELCSRIVREVMTKFFEYDTIKGDHTPIKRNEKMKSRFPLISIGFTRKQYMELNKRVASGQYHSKGAIVRRALWMWKLGIIELDGTTMDCLKDAPIIMNGEEVKVLKVLKNYNNGVSS